MRVDIHWLGKGRIVSFTERMDINPHQPLSTLINPYQPSSPSSTLINPYQPSSTLINLINL